MIGHFSNPHGGFRVLDGLIEPAELGEYVGEVALREHRVDEGRPKAFIAKVAVERNDVPLEQGRCVAEVASREVGYPQKGRRDHLRRAPPAGAGSRRGGAGGGPCSRNVPAWSQRRGPRASSSPKVAIRASRCGSPSALARTSASRRGSPMLPQSNASSAFRMSRWMSIV